jgi:hypothetical protein
METPISGIFFCFIAGELLNLSPPVARDSFIQKALFLNRTDALVNAWTSVNAFLP